MSDVLEFVLILTGTLLISIVVVGVIWVRLRARAEARRIKQHFASKRQPGRPTQ